MKRGEFIINNMYSGDLNSLIQERPNIPSAARKMRLRSIPGSSGDYIFDEAAYENVSFTLSCFTKGKTEEEVRDLKEAISAAFDTGDYTELYMYSDPDNMYEVVVTSGPDFTPNGSTPLLLPYTVTLSAKPFKSYLNNNLIEGDGPLTVHNPTQYASKPAIKVYGTGNLKLIVNGVEYPFQSIDEHVVIDSETENAYKETANGIASRNHRMYTLDFPTLDPGENTVSISGSATHYVIDPRWKKKL